VCCPGAAELYKRGEGLLLNKTHSLIKEIWKEEKIPTVWMISQYQYIKIGETNCSGKTIEEYLYYVQDIRY